MTKEIWKDIEGYEGYYQVSNLGNVRSLDRIIPHGKWTRQMKGRIKKQVMTKDGYPRVGLCVEGVCKYISVHRLVAINFIGGNQTGKEVNHKDGNKENNCVENLEWVTPLENNHHKMNVLKKVTNFDGQPRGIVLDKRTGKYYARIRYNKKRKDIGPFINKTEAYRAYYNEFQKVRGHAPWDLSKYPTHEVIVCG